MELFKNISEIMENAKKNFSEKGKKAGAAAKLRAIIKAEEKATERAYIALGKYYYNNLRDENDVTAEPYCASLDQSREKIAKAAKKLDSYYKDEPENTKEVEIKIEEKAELLPNEGPAASAYVYLNEEETFAPTEEILDEAVEQHRKVKDTEELDEQKLNFE